MLWMFINPEVSVAWHKPSGGQWGDPPELPPLGALPCQALESASRWGGLSLGARTPILESRAQGGTCLLFRSQGPTCKGLGRSLPCSQEEVHEVGAPRWGPSIWGQVHFPNHWWPSILVLAHKPCLGQEHWGC